METETLQNLFYIVIVPLLVVLLRSQAYQITARWPQLETPIKAALSMLPNFFDAAKDIGEGRGFRPETLAPMMYRAYLESSGGKNYQGFPCPKWEALPEDIQRHWIAAAKVAAK